MAHVINQYHNLDFVFNNPFSFKDRYSYSMQDVGGEEVSSLNFSATGETRLHGMKTRTLSTGLRLEVYARASLCERGSS